MGLINPSTKWFLWQCLQKACWPCQCCGQRRTGCASWSADQREPASAPPVACCSRTRPHVSGWANTDISGWGQVSHLSILLHLSRPQHRHAKCIGHAVYSHLLVDLHRHPTVCVLWVLFVSVCVCMCIRACQCCSDEKDDECSGVVGSGFHCSPDLYVSVDPTVLYCKLQVHVRRKHCMYTLTLQSHKVHKIWSDICRPCNKIPPALPMLSSHKVNETRSVISFRHHHTVPHGAQMNSLWGNEKAGGDPEPRMEPLPSNQVPLTLKSSRAWAPLLSLRASAETMVWMALSIRFCSSRVSTRSVFQISPRSDTCNPDKKMPKACILYG